MTLKKVLECLPALERIARSRSQKRRVELLKEAKNCIFFAISEICLNVLNGNIRLSKYRMRKLEPYKNSVRKIALKSTTLPARKKLIIQSGGFLPSLLIPSISVLAEIIASKYLK